tara:strand:+ start:2604 stop:3440 length:837 start_codon:yes stop_codon:yes gene_type:complete
LKIERLVKMKKHKSYYLNFAKNIFSQNGEDGIIEKLFNDLGITGGILCEFGAWDGIYLSNIANLYLYNTNYNAILIEFDSNRANECTQLLKNYNNVEVHQCLISSDADSDNSIDNVLGKSSFNLNDDNFSLLSIDIDSCDYYVFESLKAHKPKVIIIETGKQSLHYGYDYEYISHDTGCSLKSVTDLAEKKGYKLVAHTGNAFFVREDLIDNLPKIDYSIENLYLPFSEIVSYAAAFKPDGSIGKYDISNGDVYFTSSEYGEFTKMIKDKLLNGYKLI